jgi:hypothetical protein
MSVREIQSNQGFANRALPVMYLSTANSGQNSSDSEKRVLAGTANSMPADYNQTKLTLDKRKCIMGYSWRAGKISSYLRVKN